MRTISGSFAFEEGERRQKFACCEGKVASWTSPLASHIFLVEWFVSFNGFPNDLRCCCRLTDKKVLPFLGEIRYVCQSGINVVGLPLDKQLIRQPHRQQSPHHHNLLTFIIPNKPQQQLKNRFHTSARLHSLFLLLNVLLAYRFHSTPTWKSSKITFPY